jgi:phosphatidylglycerophosphatase C
VQLQTPDDVWGRIEALARAQPGGVVATDGDGTLWSGDVGEDLFHAFVEHGRVEPASLEALRRDARDHGLSDAGRGPDIARRIYAAYLDGRFPERRVCELMVWCFAGWKRGETRAFAREVVDRGGLVGRLHAEVLHVLERVRAAGIEAVLVSASPIDVVLEAGSHVGFDERHVVAALPRCSGDVMVAEVESPIPYAEGKVIRLRERVGVEGVIYAAFGDNEFDVALLASSRVPVAVRPKPRLRARASRIPGVVELARADG